MEHIPQMSEWMWCRRVVGITCWRPRSGNPSQYWQETLQSFFEVLIARNVPMWMNISIIFGGLRTRASADFRRICADMPCRHLFAVTGQAIATTNGAYSIVKNDYETFQDGKAVSTATINYFLAILKEGSMAQFLARINRRNQINPFCWKPWYLLSLSETRDSQNSYSTGWSTIYE